MLQPLTPQRMFGTTGIHVPLVGYGTAPLGKPAISRDHAARCLNHAIDLGINYIDTSPDYGSEPHVGDVMRHRRNDVFLATKVNRRSREGVLDELRTSLQRLQTDYVDLIQVHAVNTWADLEQTLAPDGAIAGLEEARRRGMVRFIGITGHSRPEILSYALAEHPFDSVLAALGMVDHLVSNPERFLLAEADQRDTAVVAMKVYGHGAYQRRDLALYYSLSMPAVCMALVGLETVQQIDEVVQLAHDYRHLEEAERDLLIEEARTLLQEDIEAKQNGKSRLFWLQDAAVMGWRQHDAPQMVDY